MDSKGVIKIATLIILILIVIVSFIIITKPTIPIEEILSIWASEDSNSIEESLGFEITDIRDYLNELEGKDLRKEDIDVIKEWIFNPKVEKVKTKGVNLDKQEVFKITYIDQTKIVQNLDKMITNHKKMGSDRNSLRDRLSEIVKQGINEYEVVKIELPIFKTIEEFKAIVENEKHQNEINKLEIALKGNIPVTHLLSKRKINNLQLTDKELLKLKRELKHVKEQSSGVMDKGLRDQIISETERAIDRELMIEMGEYKESGNQFTGKQYENPENFIINP